MVGKRDTLCIRYWRGKGESVKVGGEDVNFDEVSAEEKCRICGMCVMIISVDNHTHTHTHIHTHTHTGMLTHQLIWTLHIVS